MLGKRLNVLITAHEISPVIGSECSSGWNIITRLGKYHNITVLYASTNQFKTNNYESQILDFISNNGHISGLTFIPVPQPASTKIIAQINLFFSPKNSATGISFLYFWALKYWEKEVLKKSIALIKCSNYDILHHYNHLSFREPGYLWKLNIPFVWGPISGFSIIPSSFLKKLPLKDAFLNYLRNFSNLLQFNISKKIKNAISHSKIIYYVTEDDKRMLAKKHNKIINLLDIGTTINFFDNKIIDINYNTKLKVVCVGRVSYLKALDLLFLAISKSEQLQNSLDVIIIGDGPQKNYYIEIVKKLNIKNISWVGNIPRSEVIHRMINADILLHPSIKEAASAVILEALSVGLPVICHDAFGMKYTIDDTCGVKISFLNPSTSVTGFKNALEDICSNRVQLELFHKGALEKSKKLTWDAMVEKISNDYIRIHNGSL